MNEERGRCTLSSTIGPSSWCSLHGALGKDKHKCRTLLRLALDADRSAVQLDETFRERQAKPGALRLAQVVARGLTKLFKHQRLLVRSDADTSVDHGDLDA